MRCGAAVSAAAGQRPATAAVTANSTSHRYRPGIIPPPLTQSHWTATGKPVGKPPENSMADRTSWRLSAALVALILVLVVVSLMVGPAGLSWRAALAGLFSGDGAPGIIVRDIRLPRTLLAVMIGATLGLSGAALQGLLRNPLAEPALFGAPQAAAAASSFVIAFGFASAVSLAVPFAGIFGALLSIGGLIAIAGR